MKTLKLITIGTILFFASAVQAQVTVSVNMPSPPMWGPAGYNEVRYYYLPDVEAYYDVQSSMFIYYTGGVWVNRTYLPNRYRNYDLYGGYKVVMNDYHGNRPYDHFKDHKKQYRKGYRGQPQKTYGERPGRVNNKAINSHDRNQRNQGVNRGNQRVSRSNEGVNRGNGKSNHRVHDKGNSHGNDGNMRNEHGKGGGKGKNR